MADLSVLKEYLVKLGYQSDQAQFNQVQMALDRLTFQVKQHTSAINNAFVRMGGTVVATYGAIGVATLGMMESVSKADLGYQLYAMKMLMSVEAAKRMKIATDALGYSLDEIAWNPELAGRFWQLQTAQQTMMQGIGEDFGQHMQDLRSLWFEFTKFRVEITYLAQAVTNSLVKALGFDSGSLLNKLQEWNRWIQTHIPEIADTISRYLVPILKDGYAVFKNMADILGTVANAFLSLIGMVYGDQSLREQGPIFERIGKAAEYLSTSIRKITDAIVTLKKEIAIGAGIGMGAKAGMTVGSLFGPWGTVAGLILGGVGGGVFGAKMSSGGAGAAVSPSATGDATTAADAARQIAKNIAEKTGARADLLFAQMAYETGNFTNRGARSLHNLSGIMNPGGESAGQRNFGSWQEFEDRFTQVLSLSRYKGLFSAQNPAEYAAALQQGGYAGDANYQDYARGLDRYAREYGASVGSINVTVNATTNASADEIAERAATRVKGVLEEQGYKSRARLIVQGAGPMG